MSIHVAINEIPKETSIEYIVKINAEANISDVTSRWFISKDAGL